jgi:hypothetical protein
MQGLDAATLQAALVGYNVELDKINAHISAIRKQLGGRATHAAVFADGDGTKPKRKLSAAAIKHIADAQKKRWAAFHKAQEAAAKPKRKLSPAAKAKLVANLAKARAARAAKKVAV